MLRVIDHILYQGGLLADALIRWPSCESEWHPLHRRSYALQRKQRCAGLRVSKSILQDFEDGTRSLMHTSSVVLRMRVRIATVAEPNITD